MTMIMTTEATEFAQHQVTCEHQRFSFPLRDVVMWLRGDDEDNISHSQIQATERDRMYESLESTLDDEDDDASGYEVGSEGDLAIEKRSSLPLLESICSSEADEIETGYDGDNDHDGYSIETDSLVLAAERLPHLLNHPQRFDPSSIKGRKSVQAPRRRGARVSCVLRRNAALRPSIMRAVTKEKTEEKEELGLSFRVLRSQDSLLLTKERIENEHEVASEAEDDSFIDQTTRNRASSSSSSSVGFRQFRSQDSLLLTKERLEHDYEITSDQATTSQTSSSMGMTSLSPRTIISTGTYDGFSTKKRRSAHHHKSAVAFPSLSTKNHEQACVTFGSSCQ